MPHCLFTLLHASDTTFIKITPPPLALFFHKVRVPPGPCRGRILILQPIRFNNMLIQINTDNHISVHETFGAELNALITEKLSRFGDQITRVEVHLSDENSHKGGDKDKRCLMEARLEGLEPIVVTEKNDTLMQSINGAISKLKKAIEHTRGKAEAH